MRKLTFIEHMSLDGVIQAPGGPDEDTDNGFKYGGWSANFSDPVFGEFIVAAHKNPFDLLLGRHTYDIWAPYWPKAPSGVFADSFNAATKYVATKRSANLTWGPAEALGPDIAADVRRVKETEGPDLILWGSSSLTSVLLGNGLVDEIMLVVYPVLLGTGKRFFTDVAAPQQLELISSKPGASGLIINIYKPAGPLKTGSVT